MEEDTRICSMQKDVRIGEAIDVLLVTRASPMEPSSNTQDSARDFGVPPNIGFAVR
jgi:hypothetical protein